MKKYELINKSFISFLIFFVSLSFIFIFLNLIFYLFLFYFFQFYLLLEGRWG
jgi:hypothetical protein